MRPFSPFSLDGKRCPQSMMVVTEMIGGRDNIHVALKHAYPFGESVCLAGKPPTLLSPMSIVPFNKAGIDLIADRRAFKPFFDPTLFAKDNSCLHLNHTSFFPRLDYLGIVKRRIWPKNLPLRWPTLPTIRRNLYSPIHRLQCILIMRKLIRGKKRNVSIAPFFDLPYKLPGRFEVSPSYYKGYQYLKPWLEGTPYPPITPFRGLFLKFRQMPLLFLTKLQSSSSWHSSKCRSLRRLSTISLQCVDARLNTRQAVSLLTPQTSAVARILCPLARAVTILRMTSGARCK